MSHPIPTPTPNMSAKLGDFANVVITVEDPIIAKEIIDKYLKDPRPATDSRGVNAFTGTYNSKPVSVMSTGIGVPSMGIYLYELYNGHKVDTIIHISSAASLNENVKPKDIVIATGACSNSNFASGYRMTGTITSAATYELLKKADECSQKLKDQKVYFGQVFTTDSYYSTSAENIKEFGKMGCLAVEQECYGLYLGAAREGGKAICMYVCSKPDNTGNELLTNENLDEMENLIKLAFDIACN